MPVNPVLGFTAVLCIALGAGAAGALNQWYEADLDAKMKRTANRPLPAGRMTRQTALHFGVGLGVFSVILMDLAANHLAAAILAVSILFYVLVYTVWLKRRTAQNIVIGGAAGAFPPLIGWVAVTGDISLLSGAAVRDHLPVDPAAFLGAVAVRADRLRQCRGADAAGGRGRQSTRRQIVLYTLPMVAAAVAPWALGLTGWIYGAVSIALNAIFLVLALAVLANRATEPKPDGAGEASVRLLDPLSVRAVRRAGRRPLDNR